ncbi:RagB/SusD family nutrient uptake outer membrane protein [Mariniphaga sediminis]|uniref:RagB/SusD family nutrient uptake outer membrane protein n=1 Tax=Mariniphaga sediminis TaxID=1628158 RepID=A0A399D007_9BACT|nr:RagB/SusD family nutrient uptake outer membrane protein [Mariniphaga sediminis]RIH63991.1 RagB/SusD family nutrient uptake outer membrane protein [Mariniphaga sediminis]
MKKYNVIKISGAIFILLLFFSCEKDFLDRQPLDKVSSETFWNTESDLLMALAGCYDMLNNDGWGGGPLNYQRGYSEGLTDIGFVYWSLFSIQPMSRGIIEASDEGNWAANIYRGCYKGIAQCNQFLDNVDNATSVPESKRNAYKGEIKFLRAMFYFELTKMFGGIPLYKDTPANPDASKVAKSSQEEVYAFILEDLDFAIANLPDESYTGHAVKGSAQGIKARVLLTQEKWSDAANLLQQIMDSGNFSLYSDFPNIFLNAGQNDANNTEIMFSCNYITPYAAFPYGYNIEYCAHIFIRSNYLDYFECTDGLPISESPLYDPSDPWSNRDPRFYHTIRQPGEEWEGFYSQTQFDPTGVMNRKYLDVTIPGNYANVYLNDWNFVLLRYADILLMYAEAKNEASGPDASVYAAIDEVRARPGVNMPPVDQSKYNSKELVRDYIRNERAVELGIEGVRFDDLKRWKIAHTLLPTINDIDGTPLVFEDRQYLWPFPQSELDKNPNLVQNPGY